MKKDAKKKKTTANSKSPKVIEELSRFEYITLIAALRYFEYRMTIASATYPEDVVSRYFTGKYSEKVCHDIAHQFAEIDHHDGEGDWTDKKFWSDSLRDCDKTAWCKFYSFCRAYLDGFSVLTMDDGKGDHRVINAFYCEYKQRWYPVMMYIKNPGIEQYCEPKYIQHIENTSAGVKYL